MAKIKFDNWQKVAGPRWAADLRDPVHLIPGGAKLNASQFRAEDAVVVTVGTGGALAGATTIPVTALSGPIPSGTILDFTGAGKFALLTANAAAGATSLTVEAITTALNAGDVATYAGTKKKFVKSGTAIGRTLAERDVNTGYGPAAAADDEIYLVAFDVYDVDANPDVVLYRPNSAVKENFLPEVRANTMIAGVLTALRSRYVMERGVA